MEKLYNINPKPIELEGFNLDDGIRGLTSSRGSGGEEIFNHQKRGSISMPSILQQSLQTPPGHWFTRWGVLLPTSFKRVFWDLKPKNFGKGRIWTGVGGRRERFTSGKKFGKRRRLVRPFLQIPGKFPAPGDKVWSNSHLFPKASKKGSPRWYPHRKPRNFRGNSI